MRGLPIEAGHFVLAAALFLGGCGSSETDPRAGAPPPLKVEHADPNTFQVDHPDQFPLVAAIEQESTSQLKVTATINPDISKSVPVISLATGRVVEIKARLGDFVKKGQILLRVQSGDLAGAFSDYRKAVADEQLASAQLDRAKDLYDKGAISLNDRQVSQDAEDKAKVDVENTSEHVRVLGGDMASPGAVVDIRAPISGVITDQEVTNAAGVAGLSAPNPFTISDLSTVWVLCDVYENDLPAVRVGDSADVRLSAYPDRSFTGHISNIGPVLDPTIRTAKVRIEVANPGLMRVGMFATATFHGQKKDRIAAVPSTAILHLHDRDWVYVPAGGNRFRRVEVRAGDMLPGNLQAVLTGVAPGQEVVGNALEFQNTVEQ
jgi:cobalt-zinc-cadmium efflux system membrane fusion protein